MSHSLYEKAEVNLYSQFSKEFKSIENKELSEHIRNTINIKINNFYCFVLIKYENEIISNIVFGVKKEKDLDTLEKSISNKIKNVDSNNLNKIMIKIFIIEYKEENKEAFKKIKKEFCKLNFKSNLEEDENTFLGYIDKNIKYIFSGILAILMIIFVNKLNELGILINFISIDTLTITTNSLLFFLCIFMTIFFSSSLIGSFIGLVWSYFFDRVNCNSYFFKSNKVIKIFLRTILGGFLFFMSFDIYGVFFREPGVLSDMAINSYISQTREPSLVEVKFNNLDKNDNKYKEILLMGKDTKFIYYLGIDDIKTDDTKLKIENEVCSNKNRDKNSELSYMKALINLLYVKKDGTNVNYIAAQRYKIAKISDISFSDKLPNFDKTFCKQPVN